MRTPMNDLELEGPLRKALVLATMLVEFHDGKQFSSRGMMERFGISERTAQRYIRAVGRVVPLEYIASAKAWQLYDPSRKEGNMDKQFHYVNGSVSCKKRVDEDGWIVKWSTPERGKDEATFSNEDDAQAFAKSVLDDLAGRDTDIKQVLESYDPRRPNWREDIGRFRVSRKEPGPSPEINLEDTF